MIFVLFDVHSLTIVEVDFFEKKMLKGTHDGLDGKWCFGKEHEKVCQREMWMAERGQGFPKKGNPNAHHYSCNFVCFSAPSQIFKQQTFIYSSPHTLPCTLIHS